MTTSVEPVNETDRLAFQKEKFFNAMQTVFTEERYSLLKSLYDDYGERLWTSPASRKVHYHNAYAGGYIDHVLHVHDCAIEYTRVLKKMGGLSDFTRSELVMATLHHDLWKLGLPNGEPYYVEETSDWHRKNQGAMFKYNEKITVYEGYRWRCVCSSTTGHHSHTKRMDCNKAIRWFV
jgi:hypothetical protein